MIIFASGSVIGLTFAFDSNNLFKFCSKVKMSLVSKDIGQFTKPISNRNLRDIL